MLKWLMLVVGMLFSAYGIHGQDSLLSIQPSYLDAVAGRAGVIQDKLDRHAEKALRRMLRLEEKMKRRLVKQDSAKAKELFGNISNSYDGIANHLVNNGAAKTYIPVLDTLSTSLQFLQQNPRVLSVIKGQEEKLKEAMDKVNGLGNRLQEADQIKRFLKERKQLLKEQLSKLGFARELKRLNKQVYYYNEQVNEYKSMLKDHKKAERKTLELLSKTKLFKDFMRKNSMLASFFPVPVMSIGTQTGQAGFAGLQTRAQVNSLLNQAGLGSTAAVSRLQQNIQQAQADVNDLRARMAGIEGFSGGELDMPDFKPNSQRTKSLLKRLEFGTNIQSQKASAFFPVTTDLGLSAGYKLNDKSIIGIGASYKVGLGTGWNNIRFSSEGIGLRSFVDWKLKGSFWLSGGYEQNYRTLFNTIDQLRNMSAWQQSGLFGVSKIVSLKTKVLKKTKVQLLWDFLSYQQRPRTQTVLLRIGYSF